MTKSGTGRPKVGWAYFGSELKRRREALGLTQQDVADKVFCSASYIGQFESATRRPQLDLARAFDELLAADGFFERAWRDLIDASPYSDYFKEAAYLESVAASIREYAPMFIPGLLQTRAYARAVHLAARPVAPEEEIEASVAARLERAQLLDHPTTPMWWGVLDESVLRREVGGPAVMSEALTHIATMVKQRRIVVQVLPFSAGAPSLSGMLTLMTFEDAPPVAYEEGANTGNLLDDPATVAKSELLYDQVRAAALSPEASLAMIQAAAEDYAADEHRT